MGNKTNEFQEQMSRLNAVMGKNIEADNRIDNLIKWYRKECESRPEAYAGDHVVIGAIMDAALTGLDVDSSLEVAKECLKSGLSCIDIMTAGISTSEASETLRKAFLDMKKPK